MINPKMDDTLLIFRIGAAGELAQNMLLHLPAAALTRGLLEDRKGEMVALGTSDMGGLWMCLAVGTLADYSFERGKIEIRISGITPRQSPLAIATDEGWLKGTTVAPYAVDVIRRDDLAPAEAGLHYEQGGSGPLDAEEPGFPGFGTGLPPSGHNLIFLASHVPHAVAVAYDWQCAFKGMKQPSACGGKYEGAVIPVDPSTPTQSTDVSQWIFASTTIAWCYQHGLLAIGDDYDVVRHPQLSADTRMTLELCNPKALLYLPRDKAHWPDPEAMRRHRLKCGL